MKKSALLLAIRESSVDELKDRLKRLEEELFQHRLKRYTNQLENTNLIKAARREIARVKTVIMGRFHGSEAQAAKTEGAQATEAQHEAHEAETEVEADQTSEEAPTKVGKTKPATKAKAAKAAAKPAAHANKKAAPKAKAAKAAAKPKKKGK